MRIWRDRIDSICCLQHHQSVQQRPPWSSFVLQQKNGWLLCSSADACRSHCMLKPATISVVTWRIPIASDQWPMISGRCLIKSVPGLGDLGHDSACRCYVWLYTSVAISIVSCCGTDMCRKVEIAVRKILNQRRPLEMSSIFGRKRGADVGDLQPSATSWYVSMTLHPKDELDHKEIVCSSI